MLRLVLTLSMFVLAACGPASPEQMSRGLTYFKDSHGICYAKYSSPGANGFAIESIATVPCEKVNL